MLKWNARSRQGVQREYPHPAPGCGQGGPVRFMIGETRPARAAAAKAYDISGAGYAGWT
ncbi:hypothetical protein AA16663_0923 [Komagataeibacter rhaeticus DSM 16663]|nr:hypothetical protein AA16663_0923 [Komagataeibacter rhaeticus DSM 16663]